MHRRASLLTNASKNDTILMALLKTEIIKCVFFDYTLLAYLFVNKYLLLLFVLHGIFFCPSSSSRCRYPLIEASSFHSFFFLVFKMFFFIYLKKKTGMVKKYTLQNFVEY